MYDFNDNIPKHFRDEFTLICSDNHTIFVPLDYPNYSVMYANPIDLTKIDTSSVLIDFIAVYKEVVDVVIAPYLPSDSINIAYGIVWT